MGARVRGAGDLPVAGHYDETEEFPWPVLKKAAEVGLYGLDLYLQHQADPTGLTLPLVMEEVFWGCAGIGLSIFGTGLPLASLASGGTPEQLFAWAPKMFGTPEEPAVAAFAVTEPQAGSDAPNCSAPAPRDGDSWILDGTKVFITNGGVASVYLVVATVDPELGHRGQATFIVSRDDPGIRPGKKERKLMAGKVFPPCIATGVQTNAGVFVASTGPPAAIEYAVER